MWVEARNEAFVYKGRGWEVHLEPGKPVWLPDFRAMRVFTRRPGQARQFHKLAVEAKPLLKAAPAPAPPPRQEVQEEPPAESAPTQEADRLREAFVPVQPGERIEWSRAGQQQLGTVDSIHVDAEGTRWAYVSIGQTWAFVNLKFVTQASEPRRETPPPQQEALPFESREESGE